MASLDEKIEMYDVFSESMSDLKSFTSAELSDFSDLPAPQKTLLHIAIENNNVAFARQLIHAIDCDAMLAANNLTYQADIKNIRTELLVNSVSNGHQEMSMLLLANGAEPYKINNGVYSSIFSENEKKEITRNFPALKTSFEDFDNMIAKLNAKNFTADDIKIDPKNLDQKFQNDSLLGIESLKMVSDSKQHGAIELKFQELNNQIQARNQAAFETAFTKELEELKKDLDVINPLGVINPFETKWLLGQGGIKIEAKHLEAAKGLPIEEILKTELSKQKENNSKNLLNACSKTDADIAELLKNDFDINKLDDNGNNALHLACQSTNMKAAGQLLDKFPNLINFPDKVENTPLHLACKAGNDELIKLLLDNKANNHLKNTAGKAAHELYSGTNKEILVSLGGKVPEPTPETTPKTTVLETSSNPENDIIKGLYKEFYEKQTPQQRKDILDAIETRKNSATKVNQLEGPEILKLNDYTGLDKGNFKKSQTFNLKDDDNKDVPLNIAFDNDGKVYISQESIAAIADKKLSCCITIEGPNGEEHIEFQEGTLVGVLDHSKESLIGDKDLVKQAKKYHGVAGDEKEPRSRSSSGATDKEDLSDDGTSEHGRLDPFKMRQASDSQHSTYSEQIANTQNQINQTNNAFKDIEKQQKQIEYQLETASQQKDQLQNELNDLNNELTEATQVLAETEATIQAKMKLYKKGKNSKTGDLELLEEIAGKKDSFIIRGFRGFFNKAPRDEAEELLERHIQYIDNFDQKTAQVAEKRQELEEKNESSRLLKIENRDLKDQTNALGAKLDGLKEKKSATQKKESDMLAFYKNLHKRDPGRAEEFIQHFEQLEQNQREVVVNAGNFDHQMEQLRVLHKESPLYQKVFENIKDPSKRSAIVGYKEQVKKQIGLMSLLKGEIDGLAGKKPEPRGRKPLQR